MTFVHTLVILSIGFLLSKKETTGWRFVFWSALTLKLAAGIGIGLLYQYYYPKGGDTLWYFADGCRLADVARTDIGNYLLMMWNSADSIDILIMNQPRALFMSKLVSVFCLITQNNYWLTSCYLSLFSFICAWYIVKEITKLHASHVLLATAAATAFLFFPSIVFWSSGILKESATFGCLCILFMIALRLWRKEKVSVIVWLLIIPSIWVLWNLKYYYLAVLLPVTTALILMQRLILNNAKWPLWAKGVVWFLFLLVPAYTISLAHPNFNACRLFTVIVENYHAIKKLSVPGDYVEFYQLEPTASSILYNTPKALIAGWFRPFLWEASTWLQFALALENTLLFILFIATGKNIGNAMRSPHRLLIISAVVYVLILTTFLALSTPNLGTLARYRIGYMPILILLISINNPVLTFVRSSINKFWKRSKPFR